MMIKATVLLALATLSCAYFVPKWKPTYNMTMSTIIMPCNNSGYTSINAVEAKFGLVDFDWSNAKALWAATKPMDCEERLLTQARMVKAANPNAKVWVYRNSIKALPWFTSVRKIITDPAYASWFLHFSGQNNYHVPACDNNYHPPLCSDLYHDQEQTPGYPHGDGTCSAPACDVGSVPVGEYLFDFRKINDTVNGQTMLDWFINSYAITSNSLLSGAIDGLFLDDQWYASGPTEIDSHVMADTGLTHSDFVDITNAYNWAMERLHAAIIAANGFDWQLFYNPSTCAGPLVHQKSCAADLEKFCKAGNPAQSSAVLYGLTGQEGCAFHDSLPSFDQDLANFLLVRGDYAWFGYAWIGCSRNYIRPAGMDKDYGTPLGLCREVSPGVFQRDWTRASVTMDCNTWTPTITMK